MIYLVLSIFISSVLFVIFKLFEQFKINTLQAIVVNYCIAFFFGLNVSTSTVAINQIPNQPWFFGALILGFIFITIFNVMAITAQRNGLSVASVASKMSVIIPVIFGIFMYHETVSFIKILGIILALLAVYLTATKSNAQTFKRNELLFPFLLFLGSGVLDTLLKYMETYYVATGSIPMFLATIFGVAFLLGLCLVTFQLCTNRTTIEFKNILGGIILGVPNYYSMEFLIKALQVNNLDSSTLFPINNVSIVVLTTVFGLFFFKEKLMNKNWMGILLAIISIVLIAFA